MRHPITEQFLNRGQWKWEYHRKVDFAEIDMKASEENPARLERKLDEDRALRYGMAMDAGEEFPAIVLLNHPQPQGRVKYLVATGMHRIRGAECARKTSLDAYVVTEPDTYKREVLTRQLNSLEGVGLDQDELVLNVLYLHEVHKKPINLLAKEWNLRVHLLQAALNEKRARARARRFGYDFERLRLPQRTAIALGSIQLDSVFQAACEMVALVPGVLSGDVKDMAAEIKKARDERAQLAIVAVYRQNAENRARTSSAKKARTKPTAAVRVVGDIRRLNNQLDRNLDELHASGLEQKPQILAVSRDLIENLKRWVEHLEQIERMSRPHRRGERPGEGPQPTA